jgi:hypothetical protein
MGTMKTTLDIEDNLFRRAKSEAVRRGVTLRALVEEGLGMALNAPPASGYELPDLSVGDPDGENPLERLTWQELRQEIYGTRS